MTALPKSLREAALVAVVLIAGCAPSTTFTPHVDDSTQPSISETGNLDSGIVSYEADYIVITPDTKRWYEDLIKRYGKQLSPAAVVDFKSEKLGKYAGYPTLTYEEMSVMYQLKMRAGRERIDHKGKLIDKVL